LYGRGPRDEENRELGTGKKGIWEVLWAVPGWEFGFGRRQNGKAYVNNREKIGYAEVRDQRVPIWDG
jgi:hypothetical protein